VSIHSVCKSLRGFSGITQYGRLNINVFSPSLVWLCLFAIGVGLTLDLFGLGLDRRGLGLVWSGLMRFGKLCFALVWNGLVWPGVVWCCMGWSRVVGFGVVFVVVCYRGYSSVDWSGLDCGRPNGRSSLF
jgi:hypothetical protein